MGASKTRGDGPFVPTQRTVPMCSSDTENRPHVFLEYEFDIDAATGAILEFDADLKD